MKWLKATFAAILVLGLAAPIAVEARGGSGHHHSHGHVGVFIGVPLFSPWYWPAPYYYPPAVVSVPTSPPVYIEQGGGMPEPNYWYYCEKPAGYYPYVKECAGGWLRVVPQAPEAERGAPQ